MSEAGRPTDLTDKLFKEIKQSILDGRNLKETATYIFNNYTNLSKKERDGGLDNYIQKLYNWNYDNYLDIADKIDGWKRDRKLILAEKKIEEILELNISDKESLRVQSDIAKFTVETLGKDNYSKRTEQTGKDGKDLPTPILADIKYVQSDNSDNKDNEIKEKDKSDSRGDVSFKDNINPPILDTLSTD